jgi:hypothetical protein
MSANKKSKLIGPDQSIAHIGRIRIKNGEFVDGTASSYIEKGEVVTLSTCTSDGAYLIAVPARDGVTSETQLMVAAYQVREYGEAELWAIQDFVTTGATIGDPVYLSDATPGAVVLAAPAGSPIAVGKVLIVGAAGTGKILVRPLV